MKNLKLRKCVALILTAFLFASCTDYLEGLYPIEKTAENSENQDGTGDSENPQNPDTPSKKTFTVTFSSNADGTSGETKSVSGKEGEKVTLTANGFTRDGYAFAGWNTKADGSGAAYSDGAEITLSENLTLYAQWEELPPNTFVVSFNTAGGSTVAQQTVTSGENATKPENPTKIGYTFADWYTSTDGGETLSETAFDFDTAITESFTLYAKWNIITYAISYTLKGGEWASDYTATTGYTVEDEFSLPDASAVTRTGYGFGGWYESADGGATLAESATMQIAKGTTGNKSFFAKWTEGAVNYTVQHLQQNIADDDYTLKESEAKTGTVGMQTQATAKSYDGFSAQAVTQQAISADGSTVIEIKYDRKTYAVTFSTDGGSVVAAQTVRYEATASEPTAPTKTGYTFGGWFTSTDGGNTLSATAFDFGTKITAATALYAKWEAANVSYTVRHLFQKIDASGYEQNASHANETKSGKTGAQTQAESKSVTGFTAQAVAQQAIAADGSTLVEIRYDRNTHTVTYADGVDGETISVPARETHRYGETVTVNFESIGTRTGYTFSGWNDGNTTYTSDGATSFTLGDSDVTLVAQWEVYDVIAKIKAMTESGTVAVTGEVTADFLAQICEAINSHSSDGVLVGLDLSGAQELTEISNDTFKNCSHLLSIILPDGVTSIGENAFSGCYQMESVTLPASLKTIGKNAFYDCSALTKITIPNGVTTIDNSTFYRCTSLASIIIPETVTTIGSDAFGMCESLNEIALPSSLEAISSGLFAGCKSLESITIPNGVKSIGGSAFYDCKKLTSVTIPDSVTGTIGNWAFQDCTALKTVMIGNGVTQLEEVFSGCTALENVTLGSGIIRLGYAAFGNCTSLTLLTIPASVTQIFNSFGGCTNLTSVVFEETNGWTHSTYSSENKIDVTNPETNATNLKNNASSSSNNTNWGSKGIYRTVN